MMYLISKDLEKLVKDKNKDKSEKYVPFIGISGYPASGKSWFTRTLKNYLSQEFGLNALIIDQESYLHTDHILNSKEKPDRQ
jgi:uridine kinase